ncbi:ribosomal prt L9 [Enterospora canceri]|uniref:Ribosomal prt L9 n=1 Tax=Enterospora canceri TaxID=1081671 RepID=A0A1Y1S9G3_9MICR|nr:ribosomal prt L9 [Enterospora canceri]
MVKLLLKKELVKIPKECEVTQKGKVFTFKGPLGKQTYDASAFKFTFILDGDVIEIQSWHGNRRKNNYVNTVASHLRNNANGVVTGFRYVAKALYKHFSIQLIVDKSAKEIIIKNYYGKKQGKHFPIIGETTVEIGEDKCSLIVEGINLEHVSQTICNLENWTKKEKLYDPRIFLDGIFVVERGVKVC